MSTKTDILQMTPVLVEANKELTIAMKAGLTSIFRAADRPTDNNSNKSLLRNPDNGQINGWQQVNDRTQECKLPPPPQTPKYKDQNNDLLNDKSPSPEGTDKPCISVIVKPPIAPGAPPNMRDGDYCSEQYVDVVSDTTRTDEVGNTDESQAASKKKPYGGRPLRFQCGQCDRRFHAPSHLKRHALCHSTERPFKCHVCHKGFLQAWHLGRHMTTHTGNKPFQCVECPKTFGSRFEMNTHVNYVHKGIKEHQCPECKKFFTLRSNLKVHMRKHTGEKPYHCEMCDKKFGQRGHLLYHMQKHKRENEMKAKMSAAAKEQLANASLPPPPLINYRTTSPAAESDKDSGISSGSHRSSPELAAYSYANAPNPPLLTRQQPKDQHATEAITYVVGSDKLVRRGHDQMQMMNTPSNRGSRGGGGGGDPHEHPGPPEHSRMHAPLRTKLEVICETCECKFCDIGALKAHVRDFHTKRENIMASYKCSLCCQRFSILDSLETHIVEKHHIYVQESRNQSGAQNPQFQRFSPDNNGPPPQRSSPAIPRICHVTTLSDSFNRYRSMPVQCGGDVLHIEQGHPQNHQSHPPSNQYVSQHTDVYYSNNNNNYKTSSPTMVSYPSNARNPLKRTASDDVIGRNGSRGRDGSGRRLTPPPMKRHWSDSTNSIARDELRRMPIENHTLPPSPPVSPASDCAPQQYKQLPVMPPTPPPPPPPPSVGQSSGMQENYFRVLSEYHKLLQEYVKCSVKKN